MFLAQQAVHAHSISFNDFQFSYCRLFQQRKEKAKVMPTKHITHVCPNWVDNSMNVQRKMLFMRLLYHHLWFESQHTNCYDFYSQHLRMSSHFEWIFRLFLINIIIIFIGMSAFIFSTALHRKTVEDKKKTTTKKANAITLNHIKVK